MSEGRIAVGHPVDVGSGAVFTLSDDFVIPGSIEVRWRRHASNGRSRTAWLGVKWTVPYLTPLCEDFPPDMSWTARTVRSFLLAIRRTARGWKHAGQPNREHGTAARGGSL